ncbi:hypothetical protein Fmac_002610 [Flemingia macrophylla]|uniref:Uncharacterized protein n=1 Tax=Flemingia macrophylla TaxID=520843 RepID=A0ABD1NKF4_9FABA
METSWASRLVKLQLALGIQQQGLKGFIVGNGGLFGGPLQHSQHLSFCKLFTIRHVHGNVGEQNQRRNLNHLLPKINELKQVLGPTGAYDRLGVVHVEVVLRAREFRQRNRRLPHHLRFPLVQKPRQRPNHPRLGRLERPRQIPDRLYARNQKLRIRFLDYLHHLVNYGLARRRVWLEGRFP